MPQKILSMTVTDRDLPLSGLVDLNDPEIVNWTPFYTSPKGNTSRTISAPPRSYSYHGTLTLERAEIGQETFSLQALKTPSRNITAPVTPYSSNFPRRTSSRQIKFPSQGPVAIPKCTSSIVPSPIRPASRLPRPIRATTPRRDLSTPCSPRKKPILRHSLRQSMTMNDIEMLQRNREDHLILEEAENSAVERKLTRVTSPSKLPRLASRMAQQSTAEQGGVLKERRFVSTPVTLPSYKKENVVPVRLLRPVSPTQAQSSIHAQAQPPPPLQNFQSQPGRFIPKSRTVGVLSNIRSTFRRSRSSLNIELNNRKVSTSSAASTVGANVGDVEFDEDSSSICVCGYQKLGYWAGRFSTTHDRFNNEDLPKYLAEARSSLCANDKNGHDEADSLTKDDDAKCQRVFVHLGTLCKDEAARKSLFAFQLQYARTRKKPVLLPEGGKMEAFFERLGKRVEGAWSRRMSSRVV